MRSDACSGLTIIELLGAHLAIDEYFATRGLEANDG